MLANFLAQSEPWYKSTPAMIVGGVLTVVAAAAGGWLAARLVDRLAAIR